LAVKAETPADAPDQAPENDPVPAAAFFPLCGVLWYIIFAADNSMGEWEGKKA
jgi:ureidoglycolate hydrolase